MTAVQDTRPKPPPEVDADLEKLREMIEWGRTMAAREFIKELVARWPDDAHVRAFDRVLAPPVVTVGRADNRFQEEWAWAREHGREYPGQWLLIRGSTLIAAAPTRKDLEAKVGPLDDKEEFVYWEPRPVHYPI